MKAPDKIYIQPSTIDELPRQNIVYTKRLSDTSIEYIRKDVMLEWAKAVKHVYELSLNGRDASKICRSKADAFQMVIDKLNSM